MNEINIYLLNSIWISVLISSIRGKNCIYFYLKMTRSTFSPLTITQRTETFSSSIYFPLVLCAVVLLLPVDDMKQFECCSHSKIRSCDWNGAFWLVDGYRFTDWKGHIDALCHCVRVWLPWYRCAFSQHDSIFSFYLLIHYSDHLHGPGFSINFNHLKFINSFIHKLQQWCREIKTLKPITRAN